MKNNLENIDEVFKQAFDGFEADVDPSVWSNIQNAIGSSTAVTTTTSIVGKSIALKIVAGIIAVGAVSTGIYIVTDNNESKNLVAENAPAVIQPEEKTSNSIEKETILIADKKEDKVVVEESKEITEEKIEKVVKKGAANNLVQLEVESNVAKNSVSEQAEVADNNVSTETAQATKPEVTEKTTVKPAEQKVETTVKEVAAEKKSNDLSENVAVKQTPEVEEVNSAKIHDDKILKRFSPNGDGTNDIIRIEGDNIKEFNAKILNLDGSIVYEWNNKDGFWDGRDNSGNKVANGTYMLQVIAVGDKGKPDIVQQAVTVY